MDLSAHTTIDEASGKEEFERTIETTIEFMDTSSIEYQNEDTLKRTEMENKQVEFVVENKPTLLNKDFLEPDVLECSASTLESVMMIRCFMDSMERVKEICRICLANYIKGQSIFMIYKKTFLPHIVYNLTGSLPTRDDELPSMICFTCAELLLQAEAARKRCVSSEKFLRRELEKRKNAMEPIEIVEPQKEDLDQTILSNENNSVNALIYTSSYTSNKPSSVSIAKEHNYINFDNKKAKTKKIRCRKIQILQTEELLNIIEERLEEEENRNKTEYNPNTQDENLNKIKGITSVEDENLNIMEDSQNTGGASLLEAKYLDDTDVLYDELFSETNLQYKEDIELSIDNINRDPLGMGIILPELFLCTVCSRKITSLRAFKRHQRYHNAENFRCPICLDELTPKTIKDHLYQHKERQELTCGDCGTHFVNITDLYNHIITHVKTYKRQIYDYIHECHICYKKTPSLVSHLNHMKQKHNINVNKPFKCDKCGMQFTAKLGLQRHVDNIHNGGRFNRERKFLCSTCGAKFFSKGNLQVHSRSHTGERPYKCIYCGKSFSQINSLTVHTYIHTGEKPFICNVCGKRFKQYSHYDYHMLIHADKRPHVCNICNRAFRVRGTLNTHMKIHGSRPFRCEPCDKGYPERSGLKKHMKKIHGIVLNISHKQEEELLEVV